MSPTCSTGYSAELSVPRITGLTTNEVSGRVYAGTWISPKPGGLPRRAWANGGVSGSVARAAPGVPEGKSDRRPTGRLTLPLGSKSNTAQSAGGSSSMRRFLGLASIDCGER